MSDIREGRLTFSFPREHEAAKYDAWQFFQQRFQSIGEGTKAVDIVCVASDAAWLIEVKDYRGHSVQTQALELPSPWFSI